MLKIHGLLASLLLMVILVCPGCFTVEAVDMNRQAQVYMKYGQYEKARDLLEQSLDYDFENAASHYWLAVCYENLGGSAAIQKAVWNYEQAVSFEPTLHLAQHGYIKALYRQDKQDKSLQATRSYMKAFVAESARDYKPTINSFLEAGMVEHALIVVEKAHEVDPHNDMPYLLLARYYRDRDNKDKEVQYLTEAFKADPYNVETARRLGTLGHVVNIPQPRMLPKASDIDRELQQLQQ